MREFLSQRKIVELYRTFCSTFLASLCVSISEVEPNFENAFKISRHELVGKHKNHSVYSSSDK